MAVNVKRFLPQWAVVLLFALFVWWAYKRFVR